MAIQDKLKNAGAVFSDSKARTIFLVVFAILIVSFIVGYIKLKQMTATGPAAGSTVAEAPSIQSIPGMGQPTREYAKLQETQNIQLAAEAQRKGTAAIPTIIRTTYLESGVSKGLSPTEGVAGGAGCSADDLRRARAAGVTTEELRCRGCNLSALKAAGYTAGELRNAGFSAKELKEYGFTAQDLKSAGISAKDLAAAGFSASELISAGFSGGELKNVGYDAAALKTAGLTDADLKTAGFGESQASSSGNCSAEKLQAARGTGVALTTIKSMGCSAAAMRAAGYTAQELKSIGFGAKDLKDAGFDAGDLKSAGFNAGELRAAGMSPADLKDVGFSVKDLKDAGFSAGELKSAGMSVAELKDAGFEAKDLRAAGVEAAELKNAGFSPTQLKTAGYSDGDLIRAGVSASEIPGRAQGQAAGVGSSCGVEALQKARAEGVTAAELKRQGCGSDALRAVGYTVQDLQTAGYREAGVGQALAAQTSAGAVENLKKARAGGVSADALVKLGYGEDALKAAGFSDAEIAKARAAGAAEFVEQSGLCSVASLQKVRASGVNASLLKGKGCNLASLQAAGYSPQELAAAGFSGSEIQGAIAGEVAGVGAQMGVSAQGGPAGAVVPGSQVNVQRELERANRQQAQRAAAQESQDKLRQIQQTMYGQASELFSSWLPVPAQAYVQGATEEPASGAAGGQQFAGMQMMGGGNATAAQNLANADITKAGTILFATLDTGVNSDETSPVLATIVQDGPLHNAKLLGTFQRVDKKVVLQFNVLSVPKLPNSLPINAVAIDPNTARTALASQVDNHYMMRYGMLFASSFASGLGQAFQNSGSQMETTTFGTVVTLPDLNPTQKAIVALGNVGQQFSGAIAPLFRTPPTVKVNAGGSIGILIMSDLAVPRQ